MNNEEQIGTLVGLDLILSPEHYKEINDLKEENKQLKSILIELEEWLKEEIKRHKKFDTKYDCEWLGYGVYKELLDKIQELKEKYK